MWILVFERIVLDFVFHLVYFPLWWYTGGLRHVAQFAWRQIRYVHAYLVPDLWLKNLFVPMFGQTDWQGRIASFFIRVVNVIVRSIMLLIWSGVVFVVSLIWPLVPVVLIYFMLRA